MIKKGDRVITHLVENGTRSESFVRGYDGLYGRVVDDKMYVPFRKAYLVELSVNNEVVIFLEDELEVVEDGDTYENEWGKDKPDEQEDNVISHPSYYTQGIECMDYIESHKLNYARGNIIKYVTRAGLKDKSKEVEDLEKARWYINREIERIKAVKEGD